jgi:hypothetical protein
MAEVKRFMGKIKQSRTTTICHSNNSNFPAATVLLGGFLCVLPQHTKWMPTAMYKHQYFTHNSNGDIAKSWLSIPITKTSLLEILILVSVPFRH